MLVALAACGPSNNTASAAPTNDSPGLSQLASCLNAHGVQVATPLSRKAIHAALKDAGKSARKVADAACQQYEVGILNLPKKSKET